ncbi:MAG: EAL domain-containing protein [Candidatus Competibacteraceae bacterium]
MPRSRFLVRLICGVLSLQLLTCGLIVWNTIRLLDDGHQAVWHRAVLEHSTLLVQTLLADSTFKDRSALLRTLELTKTNPFLRYAAVFNTQRELLAAIGETPPPLTQPLAGGLRYRSTLNGDLLNIEQPLDSGGRILGIAQFGYSDGSLRDLLAKTTALSIILALFCLLLSGGFTLMLSRSLEHGLVYLKRGINALHQGELESRVLTDNSDVTGDLGRAFNALATHLQASRQELRGQHEQLRQESRRLNNLLYGINAVVWEVDPDTGRFRYVSDQAVNLLGYSVKEWLEPDFCKDHIHRSDLDWVQSFLTHAPKTPDNHTLDFRIYKKDNECRWVRMISFVEIRGQGMVLAGLLLDVTEEKLSEERIAYLADHDPLTGLINRRRFQERLEEQIAYNRRYNVSGALLYMDLDQFKYINDTYGHHTGDQYLRQVAHHLRSSLRETDIIGRLGGDEFGIILPNVIGGQASLLGNALLKTLNSKEFIHEGRRTPFNASIGIVQFPKHGESASELLAKADSAMYTAKEQGRNTFCTFQEGSGVVHMQEKIHWEERIRRALKENQFQLYFQPIVDIHTGTISHYESLLRMIGEDGKIVPPGAFIGIAERFGLIREIDRWVVANAIRTQGESMQTGRPVALTINLSGRHFGSPKILELIQETTRHYKANPSSIVFEVTETAAVENFTEACDFIQALREMRYRFALDDFGAGFSSFDYLKHIPVDYVKIDGSFVRNLNNDKVDQIFVKAIADMANGLGVKTIAEFVENYPIVETLRGLGVSLGQGYYFAKPAPSFHKIDHIVFTQDAMA